MQETSPQSKSPPPPTDQATVSSSDARVPGWANWRNTLLLVLVLLVLRIVYLVWLCPYELAGDEAQYWDWSRNLAWSYYSKGPGVAWVIGLSTGLFGNHEWAVRLPAVLAWAVSLLALARLSTLCARGDQRAGMLAAIFFALSPAFFATGQFMTIDAPFFACWIIAMWISWHVFSALRRGQAGLSAWSALALALGTGFLFKYTILLLLGGLVLYAVLQRKQHHWTTRSRLGLVLCICLFLCVISPVLIWNQQHDWPTLRHLLGQLHLSSGDVIEPVVNAPSGPWQWVAGLGHSLLRMLEMIGTQIGIVGLPLMILITCSLLQARRRLAKKTDLAANELLLICCALPLLTFYLLVAFRTKILGNWPLPGFLSLLVLASMYWVLFVDRCAAKPRGRIKGWGQTLWHWIWGWGIVGGLIIAAVPLLGSLPVDDYAFLKPLRSGLKRVTGYRQRAGVIHEAITQLQEQTGREVIVITDRYDKTARIAFYLPDQPVVFCAQQWMGDRRSGYDLFPATDLHLSNQPQLRGLGVILVGAMPPRWAKAVNVDDIRPVPPVPPVPGQAMLYTATNYQGLGE